MCALALHTLEKKKVHWCVFKLSTFPKMAKNVMHVQQLHYVVLRCYGLT
jgi:hypothetical protein